VFKSLLPFLLIVKRHIALLADGIKAAKTGKKMLDVKNCIGSPRTTPSPNSSSAIHVRLSPSLSRWLTPIYCWPDLFCLCSNPATNLSPLPNPTPLPMRPRKKSIPTQGPTKVLRSQS